MTFGLTFFVFQLIKFMVHMSITNWLKWKTRKKSLKESESIEDFLFVSFCPYLFI